MFIGTRIERLSHELREDVWVLQNTRRLSLHRENMVWSEARVVQGDRYVRMGDGGELSGYCMDERISLVYRQSAGTPSGNILSSCSHYNDRTVVLLLYTSLRDDMSCRVSAQWKLKRIGTGSIEAKERA